MLIGVFLLVVGAPTPDFAYIMHCPYQLN